MERFPLYFRRSYPLTLRDFLTTRFLPKKENPDSDNEYEKRGTHS